MLALYATTRCVNDVNLATAFTRLAKREGPDRRAFAHGGKVENPSDFHMNGVVNEGGYWAEPPLFEQAEELYEKAKADAKAADAQFAAESQWDIGYTQTSNKTKALEGLRAAASVSAPARAAQRLARPAPDRREG